jgi:hypothetical protein
VDDDLERGREFGERSDLAERRRSPLDVADEELVVRAEKRWTPCEELEEDDPCRIDVGSLVEVFAERLLR